uniref:AB hydrolase-1 domain-containing protein n=1 Tax=Vannella robusta TaxID=1487602 RepID=A0A7S4HZI8_9EUKA
MESNANSQPQVYETGEGRKVKLWYYPNNDQEAPIAYFIHGAGGRSDQFRTLTPLFRENYSILHFDFVGHGDSDKPPLGIEYYRAERIVEDLLHVYNKHKQNTRNIVICHSYGTALATMLYPSIKESVSAMIMIGTCKNMPGTARHPIIYLPVWALEWMRPMMRRPFINKAYHSKTRRNNTELIEYEDNCSKGNTMHVMKNLAWGMKWPTTEEFEAVECPCLLIGGEEDLLTPVSEMDQVHQCIPSSELIIAPNSGHFPMLENVEATAECIANFLLKNSLPPLNASEPKEISVNEAASD